ncbi:MAG: PadR family transcriptional regulator [Candidatus Angelobacter sp.]|jgi:DNA-binding PadR family transcriptional regulator|nr:PadR family transcriptional regulator [Candidatus Angelobacter sp.]
MAPARQKKAKQKKAKKQKLTTPDLVLLSLLAERAMHGYEANLELERRHVRDWAAISRPQVYYSLEKLAHAGFIRSADTDEPKVGPERRTYATTTKGRAALAASLEAEDWATQRERPPFLTWMALSWQAHPGVSMKQIRRRKIFLERELAREEETLRAIRKEVGHPFHEAVWMVSLVIDQFKTELRWLKRVEREIHRRAPAKNPQAAALLSI